MQGYFEPRTARIAHGDARNLPVPPGGCHVLVLVDYGTAMYHNIVHRMRLRTTRAHPPTYCTNHSRSGPLLQRVRVVNFVRRTDWLAVHFPKAILVLPVRRARLSRVLPLMASETVCPSGR